jgi:hypothetical protein
MEKAGLDFTYNVCGTQGPGFGWVFVEMVERNERGDEKTDWCVE